MSRRVTLNMKGTGMTSNEFTLDDIRKVVREENKQAFKEQFKPAFEEAFEPYALAIQQDFATINDRLDAHDDRFDVLETKIEAVISDVRDIKSDVKGLKRIVGQRSKEIIELRARSA